INANIVPNSTRSITATQLNNSLIGLLNVGFRYNIDTVYLNATTDTLFYNKGGISRHFPFPYYTRSQSDARYPLVSGSYANPSWITSLAWSKITSAPTTLSGYGITDGIRSLNALTATTQTFATGTSGTDFNINSSGSVHTFNIPSASPTNRGLVTTAAQIFAGDKTFNGKTYAAQVNAGISFANSTLSKFYSASSSIKDPQFRIFTFINNNEAGLDTTGTIAFTRSNNNNISLTDATNGYGYVLNGQLIGQLVADGVVRDESISLGGVSTSNPAAKIAFYSESDWLNTASAQTSIRFSTKANATNLPTERMRITPDGRIGAGTTLPTSLLHLNGTNPLTLTGLQLGATSDSLLTVASGLVRKLPFGTFWSTTGNGGTAAANNFIGTTDNIDLRFRTNNVERGAFTTSGFLGIGTTGPTRKLQVNDTSTAAFVSAGTTAMPSGIFQSINNTSNTNSTLSGLTLQNTNSSGVFQSVWLGAISNSGASTFAPDFVIGQRTGSATYAERLRIAGGGNIGINNNTPTSQLHVSGAVSFPSATISTNTTLDNTHYTVRCTVGGITVTLPTASSCPGRIYIIINYNTGGSVTTSAFLTATASSTTSISSGSTVQIQSDGTNWYKIN
ncbi:MAG TPA: hypothetical protein VGE79_11970, partial [Niastella sp.]